MIRLFILMLIATIFSSQFTFGQDSNRQSSMSEANMSTAKPVADVVPTQQIQTKNDMPVLSADMQKQLASAENKIQLRKTEILNNSKLSQDDKSRLINEIETKKDKFLIEAMGEEGFTKYQAYLNSKKKN